MASRAQVKKIGELEAQLHEAEDMVMDLREELSSVQRQLARASQKEEAKRMVQVDELRKENIFSRPNSSICPPPDKQQKFFPDSDKDMSNIGQKLYNPLFPSLRSYYKDMDLPAIISRSQGTKLYRSGCTQRILACEQKNLIHDDLTTKVDESHNPEKRPSPGNETRKIKTIASPNKKQKISSPNQKKDRAADSSSLTTTRPELQPLAEHEESELPLGTEAQVDPPEAKAETDGVPIQPLLTFQRRKKRGTEDDKNAVLETVKVNSIQETAQEKTEEIVSVEKSAKEEIPLEPIAQQVSAAEMASQAQVKKVDELEAQIHEGGDIVIDLRKELSSVQRQLARASQKEQVKHMEQVDEGSKENIFSCPNSFICPPPDNQQKFFPDSDKDTSNIGQKLYKPVFPSLRSNYNDMDLPAIISRSKRIGCTQRILACEQKNLIQDDLTTQVDESHNPETHPSPGNETRKIKTIASPNKKQKISSPNPKKDHAVDSSSFTITRPELQPLEHEKSDLPLNIEAVDPPEAKALETDGFPTKPLVTYQKRRKQGTVSTNGKNVSNNCKLKNTQDNKNAVSETEKVNSMQESAQEETKEVFSVKKSAKEEIPLEPIAQQLISLSEPKELQ